MAAEQGCQRSPCTRRVRLEIRHRPQEGLDVVDVVGQPVLHPDHPFDVVDGADQVRDEAAPLDLALQHDLTATRLCGGTSLSCPPGAINPPRLSFP